MKKHLFLILCAVVASTGVFAQQVHTYSGQAMYQTLNIYVYGTAKYNYTIGDNDRWLIQGPYTFTGSNGGSSNRGSISANMSINTQCKDGYINGAYTAKSTVSGRNAYGQSANATITFTGVFDMGKPNGLFTYTVSGDGTNTSSATLKGGKYVGAYKFKGNSDIMNGQLTADGKLTGTWKCVFDYSSDYTYVFENDVLISQNSSTPQEVQQLAKQYAAKQVTDEQLAKKGYVVATKTLPLDLFVKNIYSTSANETGFSDFPGRYKFSEYGPKTYYAIEKANVLTDEGFQILSNAFQEGKNRYEEGNVWCDTYSGGECSKEFIRKYCYVPEPASPNSYYHHITLTPAQYETMTDIREASLKKNTKSEVIPGLAAYNADKQNAYNTITYKQAMKSKDLKCTDEDKKNYEHYDTYLTNHYDNRYDKYVYRFTEDSAYILKSASNVSAYGGLVGAIRFDVNGVEEYYAWLGQQHERAQKADEEYDRVLDRLGVKYEPAKPDSWVASYDNEAYGDKVNQQVHVYWLMKKKWANEETTLSQMEETLALCNQLIEISDSIATKREYFKANLPGAAFKAYQKQEESYTHYITYEGSDRYRIKTDEYTANMLALKAMQDNYLQWIANEKKLSEKDVKVREDIANTDAKLSKIYDDLRSKQSDAEPDMSTQATAKAAYEAQEKAMAFQNDFTTYLQNRRTADQLHASITEKLAKAKATKKLYQAYYKTLPIAWANEGDNFEAMKQIAASLQKIESALQANGTENYDTQLKKAKTPEEFKAALGL